VTPSLAWRSEPVASDVARVRAIVEATGRFNAEEVAIAVELVEDRLTKGAASDYAFVLAEEGGTLVGYACFGRIPGTEGSYDVYWLAVDPRAQGRGVGREILRACEAEVVRLGGRRIYLDTSARPDYAPARAFYEACGYRCEAVLRDFYRPGDGKAIFCRVVGGQR